MPILPNETPRIPVTQSCRYCLENGSGLPGRVGRSLLGSLGKLGLPGRLGRPLLGSGVAGVAFAMVRSDMMAVSAAAPGINLMVALLAKSRLETRVRDKPVWLACGTEVVFRDDVQWSTGFTRTRGCMEARRCFYGRFSVARREGPCRFTSLPPSITSSAEDNTAPLIRHLTAAILQYRDHESLPPGCARHTKSRHVVANHGGAVYWRRPGKWWDGK